MSDKTGYNEPNVDANDEWNGEVAGQPVSGEVVERIEKANMPYITVKGCTHERKQRDPSDETNDYYAVTCMDCPMGWLIAKESK